jgi:hypothetical protein
VDWSLMIGVAMFAIFVAVVSLIGRHEGRQRRKAAEALARRQAWPVK